MDEDEKCTITISYSGRKQTNISFISESGLYALIFKSRKSEAKLFRKWVTSKVLPSIRKTGEYKLETKLQEKINTLQKTVELVSDENQTLKTNHKRLKTNHESILKRRNRTPYESGNVIYILSHEAFTHHYNTSYFKFGKSSQTKSEDSACFAHRLSTYNTGAPVNYTVNRLFYIEANDFVENALKFKYSDELDPSNKEWVKGVSLDEITKFIKDFCNLSNIKYKEVEVPPEIHTEVKTVVKKVTRVITTTTVETKTIKHVRGYKPAREVLDLDLKDKTNTDVAKMYGVSEATVRRWMSLYKIPVTFIAPKPSRKPSMDKFVQDYLRMTTNDIAKKYGVTSASVRMWRASYNIPVKK